MCFYVSHLYHQEILRMRCKFFKDFNGSIWFTYADDIWVRPNMQAQRASEEQEQRIRKINEENRINYLKMMEETMRLRQEKGSTLNQNIKHIMNQHYHRMKQEAGLDNTSCSSEDLDQHTEAVFRQLRPNANFNLVDILEGRVKQPKPRMFLSKQMRQELEVRQETRRLEK